MEEQAHAGPRMRPLSEREGEAMLRRLRVDPAAALSNGTYQLSARALLAGGVPAARREVASLLVAALPSLRSGDAGDVSLYAPALQAAAAAPDASLADRRLFFAAGMALARVAGEYREAAPAEDVLARMAAREPDAGTRARMAQELVAHLAARGIPSREAVGVPWAAAPGVPVVPRPLGIQEVYERGLVGGEVARDDREQLRALGGLRLLADSGELSSPELAGIRQDLLVVLRETRSGPVAEKATEVLAAVRLQERDPYAATPALALRANVAGLYAAGRGDHTAALLAQAGDSPRLMAALVRAAGEGTVPEQRRAEIALAALRSVSAGQAGAGGPVLGALRELRDSPAGRALLAQAMRPGASHPDVSRADGPGAGTPGADAPSARRPAAAARTR